MREVFRILPKIAIAALDLMHEHDEHLMSGRSLREARGDCAKGYVTPRSH